MKKIIFTLLFVCTCICSFAGNPMKVVNGNNKFLKEDATATVSIDWSQAQWNYEKPLTDQWGDSYQKLTTLGEQAFIEGFNEKSKKLKIQEGDAKYRIEVKISNVDKFYSVMSLVPGNKHKVWGKILVVDIQTGTTVCEADFKELQGGRDFSIDNSFAKCMKDLGKATAKL